MIGTGGTGYAKVDIDALTVFRSRLTKAQNYIYATLQTASTEVGNTLAALAEAISHWEQVLLDCKAALDAAETAEERAQAQACINAAQAKLASLRQYEIQVITDRDTFKEKAQTLLINLSNAIAEVNERLVALGIYLTSTQNISSPSDVDNNSESDNSPKQPQVENNQQDDRQALLDELKARGTKFSEKDIVFITREKSGRIVWIEEGDESRGLHHILYGQGTIKSPGHMTHFRDIGIDGRENIVACIKDLLVNHTPVEVKPGKITGHDYIYRKMIGGSIRKIVVAIGNNGFIVTAHPERDKN